MPRPITALIHPQALAANLARVRVAAPDARVFAVVKANAYGHGIARVFEALRGADGFALLDLNEAVVLRELGWRGPVLLLEGAFEPRDLELCSQLKLWHVVHCQAQIDWLATHKTQHAQRVFLKLNSGMNRLGFAPAAFRGAWVRLNALPQVEEISLMTHFADADASAGSAHRIDGPLALFDRTSGDLPGERCLSNSAALLRQPQLKSDWVRAGIALYGSSPDFPQHDIGRWGLQPTMSLRSRLIGVQEIRAGDSVGYGSAYTAGGDMRIGIVACGYADGYPRHCGSGTPVLVDGVRCATLGRVSMDMLTVDLTPVPTAGLGSAVTLWGRDSGGALLPIDAVAEAGGTLGYELMCALAARVPVELG